MLELDLQGCISIRHERNGVPPVPTLEQANTLGGRDLTDLVLLILSCIENLLIDDIVFFEAGIDFIAVSRRCQVVLKVLAFDALKCLFNPEQFERVAWHWSRMDQASHAVRPVGIGSALCPVLRCFDALTKLAINTHAHQLLKILERDVDIRNVLVFEMQVGGVVRRLGRLLHEAVREVLVIRIHLRKFDHKRLKFIELKPLLD